MIWFENTRSGQRFRADERWAEFHRAHPDCLEVPPPAPVLAPAGDAQQPVPETAPPSAPVRKRPLKRKP